MAIKLYRKDLSIGSPVYVEIPDMLDIEIGGGEEREVEEKKYISRDDDYADFDVGTSSSPEFTVTFDSAITVLEADYDGKKRNAFGIYYTGDDLEVTHSAANVTKRSWVKAGSKARRQYTIKTAGKPVVVTPSVDLKAIDEA
jgi:hypothetical protein